MDQGFVSVFIDNTEIEVNGKCFEGVKHIYRGVPVPDAYGFYGVNAFKEPLTDLDLLSSAVQ